MIEYWSWWNISWWAGSEIGLLKKTNALKTSIIVTSIIGGYMTYVYPRKIVFRIGNKKYSPTYKIMIIGDFFLHHVPLLCLIYKDKCRVEDKTCAKNVLIPFGIWALINYYRKMKVDKLYGIKMYKLMGTSTLLLCGYGYCYHYIQKKN